MKFLEMLLVNDDSMGKKLSKLSKKIKNDNNFTRKEQTSLTKNLLVDQQRVRLI